MRCTSFPPLGTRNAKALILGTMPGVKSLEANQYYAHPQNAFWPIMAAFFNAPIDTYAQKKRLISGGKLAVWDVYKHCTRPGSLDADIRDAELNDFATFFKQHRQITHVLLNGTTATQAFMRRVLPALDISLVCIQLPSTSPARTLSKSAKQKAWHAALRKAL